MDLQTLIIAMSIPSGVTAFCFWMIEQKIKKQQTETEEKEKIREKKRGPYHKKRHGVYCPGRSGGHGLKEWTRQRRDRSRPGICP